MDYSIKSAAGVLITLMLCSDMCALYMRKIMEILFQVSKKSLELLTSICNFMSVEDAILKCLMALIFQKTKTVHQHLIFVKASL